MLTDGLELIQNRGAATIVIDKVALARAKGVRVITAYLVPDTGSLYGVMPGYPPDGALDLGFSLNGFDWSRRQVADGAKVPHATRMNLVVILKPVAGVARGNAAGIDIWYHVGITHYRYRTKTALEVLFNRRSCF